MVSFRFFPALNFTKTIFILSYFSLLLKKKKKSFPISYIYKFSFWPFMYDFIIHIEPIVHFR